MPFDVWVTFFVAWFFLSIAPGPDNIFVLMQSIIYGKRDGLWVVAGLCTGLIIHVTLIAIGVTAVIRASDIAFTTIKMLGALYLVYLAILAWKAPVTSVTVSKDCALDQKKASALSLWRRGAFMNLTNPKVIIFFLAFFPQFLTEGYSVSGQMLVMGVTILVTCALVFGGIAVGAEYVRSLISSPKIQQWINRIGSVIFVMLAGNVLLTS